MIDKSVFFLEEADYAKELFQIDEHTKSVILSYLEILYGQKESVKYFPEIERLIRVHHAYKSSELLNLEKKFIKPQIFTEKDAILITYGDIIKNDSENPLEILKDFAFDYLKDAFSTIHILPFYPYSSDKGFAIKDFEEVNPDLGSWDDILSIGKGFKLMFDGVINHISSKSRWFQEFLNGTHSYKDFFIVFSTKDMVSEDFLRLIVRPRTSELFTQFYAIDGLKHVWTTFSSDQIDLNYKNPNVLLKMLDILLFYIRKGADIIRLDAVTYLWEEIGTNCIHLKQTHTIVKLLRTVIDTIAPMVALITETNVPHKENINYFGNGYDEAHMVYNFALPPLVLYTILKGNATKLTNWAKGLKKISDSATYFNFLSSHDGIGITPVEDILDNNEISFLILKAVEHGGFISYKKDQEGKDKVYELNISWYSAINNEDADEDEKLQTNRFIASRAIALVLMGVPGIYIHSLLATKNDAEAVILEKQTRSINRKIINKHLLMDLLKNKKNITSKVFKEFIRILTIRNSEKLFHPNVEQNILDLSEGIFALERISNDRSKSIICLTNISNATIDVDIYKNNLSLWSKDWSNKWIDILSKRTIKSQTEKLNLKLKPYEIIWLKNTTCI